MSTEDHGDNGDDVDDDNGDNGGSHVHNPDHNSHDYNLDASWSYDHQHHHSIHPHHHRRRALPHFDLRRSHSSVRPMQTHHTRTRPTDDGTNQNPNPGPIPGRPSADAQGQGLASDSEQGPGPGQGQRPISSRSRTHREVGVRAPMVITTTPTTPTTTTPSNTQRQQQGGKDGVGGLKDGGDVEDLMRGGGVGGVKGGEGVVGRGIVSPRRHELLIDDYGGVGGPFQSTIKVCCLSSTSLNRAVCYITTTTDSQSPQSFFNNCSSQIFVIALSHIHSPPTHRRVTLGGATGLVVLPTYPYPLSCLNYCYLTHPPSLYSLTRVPGDATGLVCGFRGA